MSDCATCGELPDSLSANTGREQYLPPVVGKLKRLWNTSGSNAFDALQCPTCGAWFLWEDSTAWTGSGNNDEETIRRLPLEAWDLFERLLHGRVDEPQKLVALFGSSPWHDLYQRALDNLRDSTRDELAAALVPRLGVTTFDGENHAIYDWLRSYAGLSSSPRRDRCQRLRKLLEEQPRLEGRAKYLLELCVRALAQP